MPQSKIQSNAVGLTKATADSLYTTYSYVVNNYLRLDTTNDPLTGRLILDNGGSTSLSSIYFPPNSSVNLGTVTWGDVWNDGIQQALFIYISKVHAIQTCVNTNLYTVGITGNSPISMIDQYGIGVTTF